MPTFKTCITPDKELSDLMYVMPFCVVSRFYDNSLFFGPPCTRKLTVCCVRCYPHFCIFSL